ncbi:MAG TPA: RNA polymerase sigma-54 factor, partial [Flavisolibacter sp.]
MSLSQNLQQKLLQKLSPQQIQLMKLLQVPTANLEERIKEELEENPALEVTDEEGAESYDEKDEFADTSPAEEEYESEERDQEDLYENIDIADYVQDGDDDIADYKLRDENYGDQEEKTTMPYKTETSFYEILEGQLGMLNLDERQYKIAEQIIGSIDEDGYLRRETSAIVDDLAFRQNVDTTEQEVEELINRIQHF